MSNENKQPKGCFAAENLWLFFGFFSVVLAVSFPIIIFKFSGSTFTADSLAKLGTVGDFLGGTTVGLLSLASILFIISTIVIQRKELELQREELKLTRQELEKANLQYEITNETMTIQRFETTFFNMLQMHGNLINDLKLFGEEQRGREVIIKFYEDVMSYYKIESLESYLKRLLIRERDNLEEIAEDYSDFFQNFSNSSGLRIQPFIIENFIETSRKYIIGDGIDMNRFHISTPSLFKLDYDQFKEASLGNYDSFSKRIKKEFFNELNYKETAFNVVNKRKHFPLSNYIKSVKTIIQYLDESKINYESQNKYLNIFFSQFTLHEIVILRYFCNLAHYSLQKPLFIFKYKQISN